MVMEDEENWCAMEAADMSKKEGIVVMLIVVTNPPEGGGVDAAPRNNKGNPLQNVGTVTRKATERMSVGRSTPIRRKPHPVLG